jgi:hypothetical protein
MRHRLQMALSVLDFLPFLLNQLSKKTLLSPKKTITWTAQWPIICVLLHELDYLVREEILTVPLEPGIQLLKWLSQNQFQVLQVLSNLFSLLLHFTFMPKRCFSFPFILLTWLGNSTYFRHYIPFSPF